MCTLVKQLLQVRPRLNWSKTTNLNPNSVDDSKEAQSIDYYSDLGANKSQQASSNPKIDYGIVASYNYLISKQELKAYQQGYQPEVQANAIAKHR